MKPNRRHEGLKKARRIWWRFRLRSLLRLFFGEEIADAVDKRMFQNLIHTRSACSGPCCGNPRKWYKRKTRQEVLADLDEKEQIEEYYSGVV
jgi:hypothetical protein